MPWAWSPSRSVPALREPITVVDDEVVGVAERSPIAVVVSHTSGAVSVVRADFVGGGTDEMKVVDGWGVLVHQLARWQGQVLAPATVRRHRPALATIEALNSEGTVLEPAFLPGSGALALAVGDCAVPLGQTQQGRTAARRRGTSASGSSHRDPAARPAVPTVGSASGGREAIPVGQTVVIAGDRSSGGDLADDFVTVYQEHYPRLVRALEIGGLDRAAAEDVAQEAFARTLGHWRRVRLGTNPPGYVYRTAFRLSRSRWKREDPLDFERAGSGDTASEAVSRLALESGARSDAGQAACLRDALLCRRPQPEGGGAVARDRRGHGAQAARPGPRGAQVPARGAPASV